MNTIVQRRVQRSRISGFTLGYNLIHAGYPIIEAVQAVLPYVDEVIAVDIGSTDETGQVLKNLGCEVYQIPWGQNGDEVRRQAFDLHSKCKGDLILFFEADEVYDDRLLSDIHWTIEQGQQDIGVYRIQVEANFQRVRWYPHAVHRVFPKGSVQYYPPAPVHCPDYVHLLSVMSGLLWDCSNIFRDQWLARKRQQARWWQHSRRLIVGEHFTLPNEVDEAEEAKRLNESHWTFADTPLAIPDILRPLLGVTDYRQSQACRVMLDSWRD